MTTYREVSVTNDQRDDLEQLAGLLSRLGILGVRGLARYACTVQDIVERFDGTMTESTFPPVSLHTYIDDVAGVM